MFHYVIAKFQKFALPHKTNRSVTKTDSSFTVQDGQDSNQGIPPGGASQPREVC